MVYQGNNIEIDLSPIKYKSALKKEDMGKAILDSADFFVKKKLSCPKFADLDGSTAYFM